MAYMKIDFFVIFDPTGPTLWLQKGQIWNSF